MLEELYSWVGQDMLFIIFTLSIYAGASVVHRHLASHPLLHPLPIAIVCIAGTLKKIGISYETYFQSVRFLHLLLGPAICLLAIPLYRQMGVLKRAPIAILISVTLGSVAAVLSALGILMALGPIKISVLASMAPKSVTTAVAMAIAEKTGGVPALAAAFVISSGIVGAVVAPTLYVVIRVRDPLAMGLGIGTASHAIGTARALQISEVMGAASALAMALNAILTAVILPVLWTMFL